MYRSARHGVALIGPERQARLGKQRRGDVGTWTGLDRQGRHGEVAGGRFGRGEAGAVGNGKLRAGAARWGQAGMEGEAG
jgi:hypothetical protein